MIATIITAYGPVHHGYIKIASKGMDVEVLAKIRDRGFLFVRAVTLKNLRNPCQD